MFGPGECGTGECMGECCTEPVTGDVESTGDAAEGMPWDSCPRDE